MNTEEQGKNTAPLKPKGAAPDFVSLLIGSWSLLEMAEEADEDDDGEWNP